MPPKKIAVTYLQSKVSDWALQGILTLTLELRRPVQSGLNKGEARNALARAVCFHRLGEIRDRSFEQQRHRASGLNLITAAIVCGTPSTYNAPLTLFAIQVSQSTIPCGNTCHHWTGSTSI